MFSDFSHESLVSVANDVLDILKSKEIGTNDKQVKVEEIINSINANVYEKRYFGQLYNMSQKLHDYIEPTEDTSGSGAGSDESKEQEEDTSWIPVTLEEENLELLADADTEESSLTGYVIDKDDDEEHERILKDDIMTDLHSATTSTSGAVNLTDTSSSTSIHTKYVHPMIVSEDWIVQQIQNNTEISATDDMTVVMEEIRTLASKCVEILTSDVDDRLIEQELIDILDFDRFDCIQHFMTNRYNILLGLKLHHARNEDEKQTIIETYSTDPLYTQALAMLSATTSSSGGTATSTAATSTNDKDKKDTSSTSSSSSSTTDTPYWTASRVLDMQALAAESTTIHVPDCKLPPQTQIITEKEYQEVHVPPAKAADVSSTERTIDIESLPNYTHQAFAGMRSLNRVQSSIYKTAYESNNNMLVCAPTGAGKTNCAMLTIIREIGNMIDDPTSSEPQLVNKHFHIVYIAPMKSLVHEMVLNFSNRLSKYGINVRELSGDNQLSRQEIQDTHIIVTTPEKWDIVTRKEGERSILNFVKLVIIDEIHLLHDSRGPVLESIVARILKYTELYQQHIRLVGLSATLPNYMDVAHFLRVQQQDVYFFNNSYRPCPLHQQFIGVHTKKAYKRVQIYNELCYKKAFEQIQNKNQVIVFTHARKDTINTAKYIRDQLLANQVTHMLVVEGSGRHELLKQEAENVEHAALKELLPYGIGFHHAGMSKRDRTLVENLFADDHLQVIIATATLAWGVNLPAHGVIIKGTDVYNPEKGQWVQLSVQDVQQMIGRAGRPQYDSYGEGILITSHDQLQFYLSLLNTQLPVESQLLTRITDSLNAEIVSGLIQTVDDAITWLKYTYFYVRLFRNPKLYGLTAIKDLNAIDTEIYQYCKDIIHTVCTDLSKCGLIQYNAKSGNVFTTELGKVSAYYYINYKSIYNYNTILKSNLTDVELLHVFSSSHEFTNITIREEERIELQKLIEYVPIPIRTSIEEPVSKVNVLLQAYISNINLTGFALASDMVYITQSASRLFRALYELVLKRGWAHLAELCLNYCKMIKSRIWLTQTPLRQLPNMRNDICLKLESKDLQWDYVCDLNEVSIGELINDPRQGKAVYKAIHQIPKVYCTGVIQPLTTSVLRVTLDILCDFQWNVNIHNTTQPFWIYAIDVDGETILHSELILLRKYNTYKEHTVSFILPVFDPLPPYYYIKIVSDQYIGVETLIELSLLDLKLPEKFAPLTKLADISPYLIKDLPKQHIIDYITNNYTSITTLTHLQSQVFSTMFIKQTSMVLASPHSSGKTFLAELAIVDHLYTNPSPDTKIVILYPYTIQCTSFYTHLRSKLPEKYTINVLKTDDIETNCALAMESNILIAPYELYDTLTRKYRKTKFAWLQKVGLYIYEDVQLLSSRGYNYCYSTDSNALLNGTTIEAVLTRIKSIQKLFQLDTKYLVFSAPIANARCIGDWLQIPVVYSFHSSTRPIAIQTNIQPISIDSHHSRVQLMPMKTYHEIIQHNPTGNTIVFTTGIEETLTVAKDTIKLCEIGKQVIYNKRREVLEQVNCRSADAYISILGNTSMSKDDLRQQPVMLRISDSDLLPHIELCSDTLAEYLIMGVGVYHNGLSSVEKAIVSHLYTMGALSMLFIDTTCLYETASIPSLRASLVLVTDTYYWDSNDKNHVQISITNLAKMTSFCTIIPSNPLYSYVYDIVNTDIDANTKQDMAYAADTMFPKCVCSIYVHQPRLNYIRKFLIDAYPLESHLHTHLTSILINEICNGRILDMQQGLEYLTETFFYKRLRLNSNYYNLLDTSKAGISEYLSELLSNTVDVLVKSNCIEYNEDNNDEIIPLNIGHIVDYHNVNYNTIELVSKILTNTITMKDLLWLLVTSTEIEQSVTVGEDEITQFVHLSRHVPYTIPKSQIIDPDETIVYSTSAAKAHVLLQAYISRMPLNVYLQNDIQKCLTIVLKLLSVYIDIASSFNWVRTIITCIECIQMIHATCWSHTSQLLQLPHFTSQHVQLAESLQVRTIPDISNMNNADRKQLLASFNKSEKMEIAEYVNNFPQIEIQYITSALQTQESGEIRILLDRCPEDDEEDEDYEWDEQLVFDGTSRESWWLMLVDNEKNVLGMKRVYIHSKLTKVKINITPVVAGKYEGTLYAMCDRYLGADQEIPIALDVQDASTQE